MNNKWKKIINNFNDNKYNINITLNKQYQTSVVGCEL